MRWTEWGGPVVTTASTGCSRRYFFRKRTEGRTQPIRGSGMKQLPRIQRERRCFQFFFCALTGLTSSPCLPPVSRR